LAKRLLLKAIRWRYFSADDVLSGSRRQSDRSGNWGTEPQRLRGAHKQIPGSGPASAKSKVIKDRT